MPASNDDPRARDLPAAARAECGAAVEASELIAGRTTPPTDAEIAAHAAADGIWLVRAGWRDGRQSIDFVQSWAPQIARLLRDEYDSTWWLPLDATQMPCAWPVPA